MIAEGSAFRRGGGPLIFSWIVWKKKEKLTTLGENSSGVDLTGTLELGETLAQETTVESVVRREITEGAGVEGIGLGGCERGGEKGRERERRSVIVTMLLRAKTKRTKSRSEGGASDDGESRREDELGEGKHGRRVRRGE